jgi:hypothetical protein
MLTLHRIKGGVSWTVLLNGKRITAYPTKREAQAFIDEMKVKYGAML